MAMSNTRTAPYSNIIHKDIQTDPSRETYCIRVWLKLLQPLAQQQKSYLKYTTHFINFFEKTMVPENTILVSMDVANIPQEEEINIVCNANTKHSTETNLKPYMTTAKSAQTYLSEEPLPTYWKKLPTNTWNCHGHQNGSCFSKYFHG